ncbi:MAG: histidine kinase [Actinomycetota bacterium]|nr:histidine kinase [Actinomycetota bacterium]
MALRLFWSRYSDFILAAVIAVAMSIELLFRGNANPLFSIPVATASCLCLTFRRRLPLAGFLLTWIGLMGLDGIEAGWSDNSAAFFVAFVVTLYSLGRHASGKEMWLGAVLVVIGIVALVTHDEPDPVSVGGVVFGTFMVGGPWAVGLAMKLVRDHEALLTAEIRQLELNQVERTRQAVTEEQARIARELHDVVSHAISVTVLQARGGRKMLGVDDDEVRRSLDAIEHTNSQALGDMRRLLALLRETDAEPQPSLKRLDALVAELRDSGLPVDLEVFGAANGISPGVNLSAYRIIKESLTNVVKHGGSSATARVTVTYEPDGVDLAISDNGSRSGTPDVQGLGLIGIRERVAVLGGQVEAGPGESGGFVVHARLPYTVES